MTKMVIRYGFLEKVLSNPSQLTERELMLILDLDHKEWTEIQCGFLFVNKYQQEQLSRISGFTKKELFQPFYKKEIRLKKIRDLKDSMRQLKIKKKPIKTKKEEKNIENFISQLKLIANDY